MTVKHLDHVNLTVASFDETADWYHRVFGFEIVEEEVTDGVRWGVIRSGDALLCIYEHGAREFADRFELRRKNLHGVAHLALRITEPDEWMATARRENLEINYGGEIAWPSSRSWYVTDPTGYEIEVVSWKDDTVRFQPLGTTAKS